MINWKVRFKNPNFIAQLVISILLPVVAYTGLSLQDLNTWSVLGSVLLKAAGNPYVIVLAAASVYNVITDPTTKGFGDSELAKTYKTPQ